MASLEVGCRGSCRQARRTERGAEVLDATHVDAEERFLISVHPLHLKEELTRVTPMLTVLEVGATVASTRARCPSR